jgi:hypothetical protein
MALSFKIMPFLQMPMAKSDFGRRHEEIGSGLGSEGSSGFSAQNWFFSGRALFPLSPVIMLAVSSCASQSDVSVKGKPISGYVRMTQVQAA